NDRAKVAGVTFDKADPSNPAADPELWERAIRKLRSGAMPPAGSPRPAKAEDNAVVSALQSDLDRAAAAKPDPGRYLLHRLNRTEYGNAIRDLLALDIDVASLLPPDDESYGFDNIADVLGVSPGLLEQY